MPVSYPWYRYRSRHGGGRIAGGGGRIAAGGGLFAGGGGLFAGGPFAAGLIAGGLFASGLNAAHRIFLGGGAFSVKDGADCNYWVAGLTV